MAFLSTSGLFTVSNITANRNPNIAEGRQAVRDAIGTLIYDFQEGLYSGALWAFTGADTPEKDYIESTVSPKWCFDAMATAVGNNPGTIFRARGFTFGGLTELYTFDCQPPGGFMPAARTLATFLRHYNISVAATTFLGLAGATGGRMDAAAAIGGRMDAAAALGGRADAAASTGGRMDVATATGGRTDVGASTGGR